MNQDLVNGYLRTLCSLLSATLVTKGILSADQASVLTTGALGVSGLVFLAISAYGTYRANSQKGKLASVAADPMVAKVTLLPTREGQALADSLPAKVTT